MRLPADAVLVVIDAERAAVEKRPRNNLAAEGNIGRLLTAWRSERLPIVRVNRDSFEAGSGDSLQLLPEPLDGETVIRGHAASAFVGTSLEAKLDAFGATTLVICGALTPDSILSTARHAGGLGYQVFVVADACWAVDAIDLNGKRWPAEDIHALALAQLKGDMATIVDTAAALAAAALAKARERRAAAKSRQT